LHLIRRSRPSPHYTSLKTELNNLATSLARSIDTNRNNVIADSPPSPGRWRARQGGQSLSRQGDRGSALVLAIGSAAKRWQDKRFVGTCVRSTLPH
jgi:hypothetical protein